MALTFKDLQNKVLLWLDGGNTTTADTDELARVQEALVEADVLRATKQRWPFMVSEPPLTFPLVPGQLTYALDATFHVPIYFWNQSRKSPIRQYYEEDVPNRDYSSSGLIDDYFVNSPQYGGILIRGQKIKTLWTPTVADTIEYQFYKLPTEMVADGDLPNIPYPHSRVLIYDALLRMVTYNEDISAAKVEEWKAKQQEHEQALLAAHDQENNQWTMPRQINWIPRE